MLDQVPADDAARRHWLERAHAAPICGRWPTATATACVQTYGDERGQRIEYIEAFEVSEYGSPLDAAARRGCSRSCRPSAAGRRRSGRAPGRTCAIEE